MTKPKPSKSIDWDKYVENGSEEAHQICLLAWSAKPNIRQAYPELKWLFHIPNGGARHRAVAGKLKAMGVKRGVPDLCLPIKRHQYLGLWIELKKKPEEGRQNPPATPEQRTWIEHLRSQGFAACVCVGWEAARDMILQYLAYNGKEWV